MIYTSKKLGPQFNIRSPFLKNHNRDRIYHIVYPEDNCNKYCIGKWVRRLEEKTKDHNARDKNSISLRHAMEKRYNKVSESDFQVIGKGHRQHNWKRNIFSAWFFKNKNRSLKEQDNSIPLQLFNKGKQVFYFFLSLNNH